MPAIIPRELGILHAPCGPAEERANWDAVRRAFLGLAEPAPGTDTFKFAISINDAVPNFWIDQHENVAPFVDVLDQIIHAAEVNDGGDEQGKLFIDADAIDSYDATVKQSLGHLSTGSSDGRWSWFEVMTPSTVTNWTVNTDDNTPDTINVSTTGGETLDFEGGSLIDTSYTTNKVTIDFDITEAPNYQAGCQLLGHDGGSVKLFNVSQCDSDATGSILANSMSS